MILLAKRRCGGLFPNSLRIIILERNQQGLGNRLIIAPQAEVRIQGAIRCRTRLGGMLNYYYRQAA